MKILLVFLFTGLMISAAAQDKPITLKFSRAELDFHYRNLMSLENYLDQSNLPHLEVRQILASMDSLIHVIQRQGGPQANPPVMIDPSLKKDSVDRPKQKQ